ncbi:MAG TPA: hypothetical protein VHE99_09695 [Gammaproteobacteria bacterium]|nr:hypothetical protein [Gammaproteobacteria bacterium]
MRYGKIITIAALVSSLAACSWIPPTNEQPPKLPSPDLRPLDSNAPDAQGVVDTEKQVWPDDAAPVVVPPGLQKSS